MLLATGCAQPDLRESCRQKTDMPKRIEACSILLQSGAVTGRERVWAYNERGIGYERTDQNEKAIADYTAALKIKPDYALGFLNRGYAKNKLGRYRDALTDLNASIALNGSDWKAFHHRGNAYAGLGRIRRAIADFEKSVRLAPNRVDVVPNKAYVANLNAYKYLALGDLRRAEASVLYALKASRKQAYILDTAGDVSCRQKRPDRALEYYRVAFTAEAWLLDVKRKQMAASGFSPPVARTSRDVQAQIASFQKWIAAGCPGVVIYNRTWFPVPKSRE